jgi:hypothetical protein
MPTCIRLVSANVHRSRALGVQFHRCRTDDTNSSAFRLAIPDTDYHLPTNPLRSRSDRKKKCNSPPFIRTSYRCNRARRLDEHHRSPLIILTFWLSMSRHHPINIFKQKALDLDGTNQIERIDVGLPVTPDNGEIRTKV